MLCKFEPIVLIFWDFTEYPLLYTMTGNAEPVGNDIETLQATLDLYMTSDTKFVGL